MALSHIADGIAQLLKIQRAMIDIVVAIDSVADIRGCMAYRGLAKEEATETDFVSLEGSNGLFQSKSKKKRYIQ